jgi:hypothetical protein
MPTAATHDFPGRNLLRATRSTVFLLIGAIGRNGCQDGIRADQGDKERHMAERKTTAPRGAGQSGPPRTLMQAHEALVRIRPKGEASLAAWQSYYERSAALYRQIAEIDRGHHHEASYWAEREQNKATELAAKISAGTSPQQRAHVQDVEGG